MAGTVVYWCPRCLERTDGPVPVCAGCGLPQGGEEIARLRVIVHRLHELSVAESELQREREDLVGEQQQLMAVVSGDAGRTRIPSGPIRRDAAAPPASGDVRADVVRDVLLWAGGLLLAIAALTFAAFAWQRLDDGGRAALLVVATVASVGAAFAVRRRLAATAEVFAALGIGLFLIDWLALRRAGAGDTLDLPTWWAIGSAAAAALALGLGRLFASARLLTAIAASASAFLAVGAGTQTAPTTSTALSITAVGAVTGAAAMRRVGWSAAAKAFVMAAGGAVGAAALAVYAGVADHGEPSVALALAASFLAAGPVAAAALLALDRDQRDGLVAAAAVAVLAGAAIGWWLVLDEPWLAAAVAVTTLVLAAVAAASPRPVRRGGVAGSAVVLLVALAFSFDAMAIAVGGPLASIEDVWGLRADRAAEVLLEDPVTPSEAAASIVSASCLAALAALGALRRRGRHDDRPDIGVAPVAAGAGGAVAVALVPLAFEASVVAAAVITSLPALAAVVGLGWLARREDQRPAVTAAVAAATALLLIPAAGWALAAEAATLLVASGALVATAAATALAPARTATRRLSGAGAGASFVVLGAATVMSAGGSATEAGIVAAAAAALVLAGSTWWAASDDGVVAELVSLVGILVGVAMALEDGVHRAIAVTLVIPAFATAGARPDRRGYLVAGCVCAVLATWAWLGASEIRLLEAYTIPAALGALLAGRVVRSSEHDASSWSVHGPGLLIGFGPSLALAVTDDVALRTVLVAAGAVAVSWAGGQQRLQAPLLIGIGSVVVLAIDTVGPIAAELPRWLTIAIVGAILLWLGATAERRLDQLRATRDRLTALEQDEESAAAP